MRTALIREEFVSKRILAIWFVCIFRSKQLTSLRLLILDGTKVTDVGIQELYKLEQLLLLGVNLTKVTEEGKVGIQTALPKLRFYEKRLR
jgi:hypothetical protein